MRRAIAMLAMLVLAGNAHAASVADKKPGDDAGAFEERLRKLEAKAALYDLEAEYAHSYDSGDCQTWANLFAENGVFEVMAVGSRSASATRGRPQLVEFCERSKGYRGLHYFQPPHLKISGDRAEAEIRSQWVSTSGSGANFRSVRNFSVIRVVYRRTADGWHIEHRQSRLFAEMLEGFHGFASPGE